MIKKFLIIALGLSVFSCSNPSINNVRQENLSAIATKSIYIFRFEGNPSFVDESTDYFVSKLSEKIPNKIIQGGTERTEGVDIGSGTNISASTESIKLAKSKGAGIAVFGKVTSHKTDFSLNGFSTIRAFDTETGEMIASFHEPSGKFFGYSEHQLVMAAVERTANQFANALKTSNQK